MLQVMDDFLDKCEDGFQGPQDLHHIDPRFQKAANSSPQQDKDAVPKGNVQESGERRLDVQKKGHVDEKADRKKARKCDSVPSLFYECSLTSLQC